MNILKNSQFLLISAILACCSTSPLPAMKKLITQFQINQLSQQIQLTETDKAQAQVALATIKQEAAAIQYKKETEAKLKAEYLQQRPREKAFELFKQKLEQYRAPLEDRIYMEEEAIKFQKLFFGEDGNEYRYTNVSVAEAARVLFNGKLDVFDVYLEEEYNELQDGTSNTDQEEIKYDRCPKNAADSAEATSQFYITPDATRTYAIQAKKQKTNESVYLLISQPRPHDTYSYQQFEEAFSHLFENEDGLTENEEGIDTLFTTLKQAFDYKDSAALETLKTMMEYTEPRINWNPKTKYAFHRLMGFSRSYLKNTEQAKPNPYELAFTATLRNIIDHYEVYNYLTGTVNDMLEYYEYDIKNEDFAYNNAADIEDLCSTLSQELATHNIFALAAVETILQKTEDYIFPTFQKIHEFVKKYTEPLNKNDDFAGALADIAKKYTYKIE